MHVLASDILVRWFPGDWTLERRKQLLAQEVNASNDTEFKDKSRTPLERRSKNKNNTSSSSTAGSIADILVKTLVQLLQQQGSPERG
ncbi:hypothetical protein C1645_874472 [Glomus cerebriforme]|uniref:Uncharacterized protein n=1 Tax=Glomus cerebriforme TaxID=658196 RepID=A0A397T9C8_9GLOM|nr:hypothetical protein C1645_874472 [Glomus cerebriforme]